MKIILTETLKTEPPSEFAVISAITMPQLLLKISKRENDALITKILSRSLCLRIRCKFDDLFVETKALQDRLRKLNRKQKVDNFTALMIQTESGTISNALRCLSDDSNDSTNIR